MTNEEFEQLVRARLTTIDETLASKGVEYQRGEDRLGNFKRAAELQRCTPERALLGQLSKHLVSVIDLVRDLDDGRCAPVGRWDEKLGDAVNYLILLEALVKERCSGF